MDLTHLHLLLNHFPTVGTVITLGLLLASLVAKSEDLKRAALIGFLGLSLISIVTYVTGNAAENRICPAKDASTACPDRGISHPMISTHEGAAFMALGAMEVTGAFAWLGLWQYRRISRLPRWNLIIILLLGILTFALMASAANLGGEIHHPEVRTGTAAANAPPGLARTFGLWVLSQKWTWPACETLHFIGLSLLFGVATVVDLRMLGVMKSISFPSLHRLLPWGILGFGINLVTGMIFFVAAPEQYRTNTVFYWKLAFMLLAGLNVLYFTVFEEAWEIGPGEKAPMMAKIAAVTAFIFVLGVLYCGRMLPFLGNAF